MGNQELSLGIAEERMMEMVSLRGGFKAPDKNVSLQQWMTECIATIKTLLFLNKPEEHADLLVTLATAMWQAGYEAAPKLEFVLPEGGVG